MPDRPYTVTISGSYRKHLDRILVARAYFEGLGAKVLRPHTGDVMEAGAALVRLAGDSADPLEVQREQFAAIAKSDLVYVVNPGGYVGPSATAEVGYAYRGGTPVVSAELPFEEAVQAIVQRVGTPADALAELGDRAAT